MVNNVRWAALPVLLGAAGCQSGRSVPEGFQGVIEHQRRVVSFEASARIERVAVHRGDLVKDGDILVQLDDSLAKLSRNARREEVNVARAELALLEAGARHEDVAAVAADSQAALSSEGLARKSAERAQTLFASGAIPRSELDKAEADLQRATFQHASLEQRWASLRHGARPEERSRAQARLGQAESALAVEEERLARCVLRVKGAGEVLDVNVEPGELAAVGAPAVTVADTGHPWVEVFVPEGELAGLQVGARAQVQVDASAGTFGGSVELISPQTEFSPHFLFSERERPHLVIRVRVRIEDPTHQLHAGVPAFARFEK